MQTERVFHMRDGKKYEVTFKFDIDVAINRLGCEAIENKGKCATALHGAIKVTAKEIAA